PAASRKSPRRKRHHAPDGQGGFPRGCEPTPGVASIVPADFGGGSSLTALFANFSNSPFLAVFDRGEWLLPPVFIVLFQASRERQQPEFGELAALAAGSKLQSPARYPAAYAAGSPRSAARLY